MQALDLLVRAGESWDYSWTITDSSGAALDPTGYSATLMVYEADASEDPVLTLALGSGITLTTGLMAVNMTSVQTFQLLDDLSRRRSGRYSVWLTSGAGKPLYVSAGKLDVVKKRP